MKTNMLDALDTATLAAIGNRIITVRADGAEWGAYLLAGTATVTRDGIWAGTVTWGRTPLGFRFHGWTRSFSALSALESKIASLLT